MSVHPKLSIEMLPEETDSDGSGTSLYLDDHKKKKKNQLPSILKKQHQELHAEFEKKQLPAGVLRLAVFIKKLRKNNDEENSFEFEVCNFLSRLQKGGVLVGELWHRARVTEF